LTLKITLKDYGSRKQFALEELSRVEEGDTHLDRLCSSDEATFHVFGTVSRHNCVGGEVKVLKISWNMSVMCFDEEQSYRSYSDW
jgi:hypothetical protein